MSPAVLSTSAFTVEVPLPEPLVRREVTLSRRALIFGLAEKGWRARDTGRRYSIEAAMARSGATIGQDVVTDSRAEWRGFHDLRRRDGLVSYVRECVCCDFRPIFSMLSIWNGVVKPSSLLSGYVPLLLDAVKRMCHAYRGAWLTSCSVVIVALNTEY